MIAYFTIILFFQLKIFLVILDRNHFSKPRMFCMLSHIS